MTPTNAFDPQALQAAVQKILADSTPTIPDEHSFAAIVDPSGARIAVASRTTGGWFAEADADYNWTDRHDGTPEGAKGFYGALKLSKTW